MGLRKAVGSRGSWFATIDGEAFPCVHAYWYKRGRYDDPHYVAGARQWEELVTALRDKRRAILTQDEAIGEGIGFNRTAYVGLFEIDDIQIDGTHLTFRMVRRIESLQR